MNPREEIAHLTEVLERANHQYYVLDAPEMEDYEYDRLLRRLEELEPRIRSWHRRSRPRAGSAARR